MLSLTKISRLLVALAIFGLGVEFWARVDDYITYRAPMLGVYNSEHSTLEIRWVKSENRMRGIESGD